MRAASLLKTVLAGVVLASSLVLAGCGDDDPPTTPTDEPTVTTVTFASNLALTAS
jgi:hypothetical protein